MARKLDMQTKVDLSTALDALYIVGKKGLKESFTSDCCIAATHLTVKVLRKAGFEAKPLPTTLQIFNKAYQELMEAGERPWERPDKAEYLDSKGAWSVGVGYEGGTTTTGRPGWGGHLVALLPKHRLIVDLSVDQASRPHKDIVLPPVWVGKVNEEFLSGADKVIVYQFDRGVLRYERTDRRDFNKSKDWTDYERIKSIVRAVEKELR